MAGGKKKGIKVVPDDVVVKILEDYHCNDFSDPKFYKNNYNRTGPSYRDLAKKYGYCLTTITKIIQGKY